MFSGYNKIHRLHKAVQNLQRTVEKASEKAKHSRADLTKILDRILTPVKLIKISLLVNSASLFLEPLNTRIVYTSLVLRIKVLLFKHLYSLITVLRIKIIEANSPKSGKTHMNSNSKNDAQPSKNIIR